MESPERKTAFFAGLKKRPTEAFLSLAKMRFL
jgi:hypothetical protein